MFSQCGITAGFQLKGILRSELAMDPSILDAHRANDRDEMEIERRLKIKAIADAGVDQLKEPMGCSTCTTITVDWTRLTSTVIRLSINYPCTLQGITCGLCMFPVLGLTRSPCAVLKALSSCEIYKKRYVSGSAHIPSGANNAPEIIRHECGCSIRNHGSVKRTKKLSSTMLQLELTLYVGVVVWDPKS